MVTLHWFRAAKLSAASAIFLAAARVRIFFSASMPHSIQAAGKSVVRAVSPKHSGFRARVLRAVSECRRDPPGGLPDGCRQTRSAIASDTENGSGNTDSGNDFARAVPYRSADAA